MGTLAPEKRFNASVVAINALAGRPAAFAQTSTQVVSVIHLDYAADRVAADTGLRPGEHLPRRALCFALIRGKTSTPYAARSFPGFRHLRGGRPGRPERRRHGRPGGPAFPLARVRRPG